MLLPVASGLGGAAAGFDGVADFGGEGGGALEELIDGAVAEEHDDDIGDGVDADVVGGGTCGELVAEAFAGADFADADELAGGVFGEEGGGAAEDEGEAVEARAWALDGFAGGEFDGAGRVFRVGGEGGAEARVGFEEGFRGWRGGAGGFAGAVFHGDGERDVEALAADHVPEPGHDGVAGGTEVFLGGDGEDEPVGDGEVGVVGGGDARAWV